MKSIREKIIGKVWNQTRWLILNQIYNQTRNQVRQQIKEVI
jgi:hypothetical protein